jgi:dolichyl-phosphate beta-glucosyltransferase
MTLLPILAGCHTHIVVPCYNEESRLPRQAFLDFVDDKLNSDIFFTFVNDGSSDGTMKLIDEMVQGRPGRIFGLDLKQNQGKAEAVRKGMLHAMKVANLGDGDFVGFWDADLATPLETIPKFASVLQERSRLEMVFGARVALLGRDIQRKADRHYLGRIFATLASTVLDLPIYDTQCGAKMFRATQDLRMALSRSFTSGWIFDVELIARLISQKSQRDGPQCRDVIYEYPLEQWHDIAGSKLSFSSKVNALYGLGSIWYTYFGPLRTPWPWPAADGTASAGEL